MTGRPFLAVALMLLAIPAEGTQWRTVSLVNEFNEVVGRAAVSQWVSSIRAMGFPYEEVKARLWVECDSVHIVFTELHWDGASLYEKRLSEGRYGIKIRADGEDILNWFHRSPPPGAKSLGTIFALPEGGKPWEADREEVIRTLNEAGTLAASINWYGEGPVAFRWSLSGSTAAIEESCSP